MDYARPGALFIPRGQACSHAFLIARAHEVRCIPDPPTAIRPYRLLAFLPDLFPAMTDSLPAGASVIDEDIDLRVAPEAVKATGSWETLLRSV